ncbi:hypothetical protein NDU88_000775 [Pleurodeles waltl]|uniref:Uncharacterized protein n=1 Tax=Pleurodeles waltl TaxID=8319 RepID=A0AAV7R9P8_PLEWA|nr:hypothetical protein NDU88_000775 [Pleurodeles waltl]
MGGCSMSTESIDAFEEDVLRITGCDVIWPEMISMEHRFLTFLDVGSTQALGGYNQANMNFLGDKASTYASEFVKSVGGIAQVPNAFGIGALILSMFLDLALSTAKKTPSAESVLLSVFSQEKVSEVRDLVDAYTKRWKANIRDGEKMIEETRHYEQLLSDQLTRVRNSMLRDGQGNTRSVRVWMHGAAFHVHMNIYQEALRRAQGSRNADLDIGGRQRILSYIDDYIKESENLLEKYKTFRKESLSIEGRCPVWTDVCKPETLVVNENGQSIKIKSRTFYGGGASDCKIKILDRYLEKMYTRCPPPEAFKNFLLKTKNKLNTLLLQTGSFPIQ